MTVTKPSKLILIFQNHSTILGFARYKLGDIKGAIADYAQSIKINPKLAEAYDNRGTALAELGDKKGAIQDFKKAEELYGEQKNPVAQNKMLALLKSFQS